MNNKRHPKLLNLCYFNLTDGHIESLQQCIPYLEYLHISGNSEMSCQAMKYIYRIP